MVHKARRSSLIRVKWATIILVLFGLWVVASISAVHVFRKAFTVNDSVDESDGMLSYRVVIFIWLGGEG